MSWSVDGSPLESILISRLRYLGDVIMSLPLLEVLRKGDPLLDIGYLCESAHGAVLANHPCINRVHLLGVNRKGNDAAARSLTGIQSGTETVGSNTAGMVRQLRKEKYSCAVDLFFNPRSAWLLRFSGTKIRICGDAGKRRKLFTHSVKRGDFNQFNNPIHDDLLRKLTPGGLGEHMCRLAPLHHDPSGLGFLDWLNEKYEAGTLKPRIKINELSKTIFAEFKHEGSHESEPYLIAAPTATWPSKMMPADLWLKTLTSLAETTGREILVLTVPGNYEIWQAMERKCSTGRISVLEPMGLPGVLGLVKGAEALLTVDGGIMHAGVALGTPTVGLFGPTDPAMWFPYEGLGPFRVLTTRPQCSPCHLHHCNDFICMPQLQVQEMVATVQSVIFAKASRGT